MNEYLLWVLVAVVVLMLAIAMYLLREQRKLRQALQSLELRIQRSNEDVAGLCSAAVAVDRRLAASDSRLNSIADQVVNTQRQPQPIAAPIIDEPPIPAQGYENVIQSIRRGVGIEELVRDFGLTRDEAVLLMRLHGGRSNK